MENGLLDPFERLLEQISSPVDVRKAEATDDTAAIWSALRDSGFADALVAEADGGAGLSPAEMAPLLIACGRHLLPVAFGETMAARALAAAAGTPLGVDGPVLLWPLAADGRACSIIAPVRGGAGHALVQQGAEASLRLVIAGERDGFGLITARLDDAGPPLSSFSLEEGSLLNWAAALTVANMTGAMGAALDLTITHVNDRQQFGRPLAKFQAIQQQISVMAERVATANVAAHYALARPMPGPATLDVAVARTVVDEAAAIVCAGAHAAFGAIGITAEHALPLYTRRIKRGQLEHGSADYWAPRIGAARLAQAGTTVDFLRALRDH